MRRHFSTYIEKISDEEDLVFITGDLGYNALENVRQKLGDRFINAGVAEQNMIGMAAGISSLQTQKHGEVFPGGPHCLNEMVRSEAYPLGSGAIIQAGINASRGGSTNRAFSGSRSTHPALRRVLLDSE